VEEHAVAGVKEERAVGVDEVAEHDDGRRRFQRLGARRRRLRACEPTL
jgi:hypothetical protein